MSKGNSFLSRVQDYVESDDFFDELVDEIAKIDNANYKAKLLLELVSYVTPKLKTQDAEAGKQSQDISIIFTDAVEPPKDSEGVIDTDDNTSTLVSEEVPTD